MLICSGVVQAAAIDVRSLLTSAETHSFQWEFGQVGSEGLSQSTAQELPSQGLF